MKRDLIFKLAKACPQAWRGLLAEGTNLAFGCQVGDGWFELLMNLCITLQIEFTNFPEPDFHFTEVKEKHGKLHIVHQGSENDDVYKIIDVYCDESLTACELCGSFQHVQLRDIGDDVKKTLCITCVEPFEAELVSQP